MDNEKFSASLKFGTVITDSNSYVEDCIFPITISRVNKNWVLETYSFPIPINGKMNVMHAKHFAIQEAKRQFSLLRPDAELALFP